MAGLGVAGLLGIAKLVPPLPRPEGAHLRRELARVLDQAHGAPTLASAVNIGAFNLGNALSAWLGGVVISAGFGYTAPNWVGAVLAGSALVLAVWSATLERGAKPAGAAPTTTEPSEVLTSTTS
nr:hypothetical protein [Catenulispora acidiphila]